MTDILLKNKELFTADFNELSDDSKRELYKVVRVVLKNDNVAAFKTIFSLHNENQKDIEYRKNNIYLPLAIEKDAIECLKYLDVLGVDYDHISPPYIVAQNLSALLYAMDRSQSNETVEFILSTGVDKNYINDHSGSALHRAISYQDPILLELLLKHKIHYYFDKENDLLGHVNLFVAAILADIPPKNHFELLVRYNDSLESLKEHYDNLLENKMDLDLASKQNQKSIGLLKEKINVLEQKALLEKEIGNCSQSLSITPHKI